MDTHYEFELPSQYRSLPEPMIWNRFLFAVGEHLGLRRIAVLEQEQPVLYHEGKEVLIGCGSREGDHYEFAFTVIGEPLKPGALEAAVQLTIEDLKRDPPGWWARHVDAKLYGKPL
ncbi:MAG: hypothetical protein V1735_04165 [Nanoarchaeota archaeon]